MTDRRRAQSKLEGTLHASANRTWGTFLLLASLVGGCESTSGQPRDGGRDSDTGRPDAGGDDGGEPPAPTCGDAPDTSGTFSRSALLGAAGQCAMWQYCRFEVAAIALRDALRVHQESGTEETLAEAQEAFREAMDVWSSAELFQFGPAGSRSIDAYHGQSIRDLVYAWPNTSRCRVEEQLVRQTYPTEGFDRILINGRGLFAIEYGIFYEGSDSACAASSPTQMAWADLSAEEIASRKIAYARAVSENVLAETRRLREAWSPEGGNFAETLANATGYPDLQQALTVVAWSLVYIEREVKDWKVGPPAGYVPSTPVGSPETPFAEQEIENVRANLRGFRALFEGCGPDGEGIGYDDWLREAGHQALADEIVAAWRGAQEAADAFPSFAQATMDEFEALYQAIKRLTDLLKTEFLGTGSPLNLAAPPSIGGDTD